MATLDEIQAAERERVERLADALESRAHDLDSMMKVLVAAQGFGGDPVRHIKLALRNYVDRSINVYINMRNSNEH